MAANTESDEHVARRGTGGFSGQLYEVKMCCLMYLRGIRHGRFHLAANLEGAGAFDDVVLRLHGESSRTLLIQLKHKRKSAISRKHLLSSSAMNKFGLLRYFTSYRDEILSQFDEQRKHPIFGAPLEHLSVVIYTNTVINGFPNASDYEDCVLNTSSTGRTFSFQEERDMDVWNLPQTVPKFNDISQYKSFLQKLKVCIGQASVAEIDKTIKTEMCNLLKVTSKHCEFLFPKLLAKVETWWGNPGRNYLTEKSPLWNEMITEVLLMINEPISRQIRGLTIRFNENAVTSLVERLTDSRVLLCQVQGEDTRLGLCKVVQVFEQRNLRFVTEHDGSTLRFWQSPWCDLLVLECHEPDAALLSTLAGVLGRHPKKKLVVVVRATDFQTSRALRNLVLSGCVEFMSETSLTNLDGTSQERLLSTKVNFQGHKVPLRDLIETEHVIKENDKVNLLLKMMNKVASVLDSSKGDLAHIKDIDIEPLLECMNFLETRRRLLQYERNMKKPINTDALQQLQKDEAKLGDDLEGLKKNLRPQTEKVDVEFLIEKFRFINEHLQVLKGSMENEERADSMSHLLATIITRRNLFGQELYVNTAIDSNILLHLKKDEELLAVSIGTLGISQHDLKTKLACESLMEQFNDLETVLDAVRNKPEISSSISVDEVVEHLKVVKKRRNLAYAQEDFVINLEFLLNMKQAEEKMVEIVEHLKLCRPEIKDWMNVNTIIKQSENVAKFLNLKKIEIDLSKHVHIDSLITLINYLVKQWMSVQNGIYENDVQITESLLILKVDEEHLVEHLNNMVKYNLDLKEAIEPLIHEIGKVSECIATFCSIHSFKKVLDALGKSLKKDSMKLHQTHSQLLLSEAKTTLLEQIREDILHLDASYRVQFLRESLESLHKNLREDAMCLTTLHCEHTVKEALSADLLYSFLQGETLCLGAVLEKLSPYYIPRTLQREDVEYFEDALQLRDRIVVISAEPGMGKSTLMTHLALQAKIKKPSNWVVKVNLGRMASQLKNISSTEVNPEQVFQFLAKAAGITRPFDMKIFQHILNNTGRMVVFLDGFEVVCPHYKDQVMSLLKQLEATNIENIWISTRQYMRKELETFTGSRALSMREFTEDDQRRFLRRLWSERVSGLDETHLAAYIDGVLRLVAESLSDAERTFMGLPLQTVMVAEVFESDLKDGYQLGKSTPRHLDVTKLYEQYFCKKCEIYFEEKEGVDINTPGFILDISRRQCYIEHIHTFAALASYLSQEELLSLQNHHIMEKSAQFVREYQHQWAIIGIVTSVEEGKPQFHHRTIEEFLVGKWFSKNFSFARNFIITNFFTTEYSIMRMIFDRMLASGHKLHCAVLNEDIEYLKLNLNGSNVNQTDEGKRTLLHIAAASKSSKENKEVLRLLLHHDADTSSLDDVLQWTPMQYADHTANWSALDMILSVKKEHPKLTRIKMEKVEVLHTACKNGYLQLLRYLVRKGMDLNSEIDNYNTKPLHLATQNNQVEVVEYLLRASKRKLSSVKKLMQPIVKLNATDYDGRTALHYAAIKGHHHIIALLLNYGCATDVRDKFDRTAVDYAAKEGNLISVNLLVRAGSKLDVGDRHTTNLMFRVANEGNVDTMRLLVDAGCSLDARDECQRTPLHCATERGFVEMVTYLVEAGDALDACDANGMTSLHYAALNGRIACVIVLVSMGAQIYARDVNDRTPLHFAAQRGNQHIVKVLVEAVSMLEVSDSSIKTPLHYASQMGHVETVRLLVKSNSKVDSCDRSHMTPLHHAAEMGHFEVANILIRSHCNIDVCDVVNMTPLHLAVLREHVDVVRLLVSHGCRLDVLDEYNSTPIDYAIRAGNLAVVKMLAEAGSKLHAHDKNTVSLLFRATMDGVLGIVKCLIHSGISLDSRDETQRSCLHLAAEKGHLDIARFLVQSGGQLNARDESLRTPLHWAAAKGHLHTVKLLVKAGSELDACDLNMATPLHSASRMGHVDTVSFLVASGCKVGVFDDDGKAPVHHAAENGHCDTVRLFAMFGCDLNASDTRNMTPLLYAVQKGHFDIARLLIQARCKVDVFDTAMRTPLHYVALKGCLDVAQSLVDAGCTVDPRDARDMAPSHHAAREGHVDIVKLLVRAGCKVDTRDDRGMSPLHYSAREGHRTTVKFLLESGCETDASDAGNMTPLHYAAREGRADSARMLIDAACKVDALDSKNVTPLHYAAGEGHLEVVRLLVEANCNAHVGDSRGETPLHHATKKGHRQIVRFLIKTGSRTEDCDDDMFRASREGNLDTVRLLVMAGYNVTTRDQFQRTPLHYAVREGHREVAETLIDQGYGVEERDRHGCTPLHYAAEKGHPEIARLLVDAGSDVDVVDEHGRTPLHDATIRGCLATARLLVRAGCKVNVFDSHDKTPLHYAAANRNPDILRLLIGERCHVDATDRYFMTPLHYAAAEGNLEAVMILMKAGCDVNACDEYNMTAVRYAERKGHLRITRLLVAAGCKVDVSNEYMASLAYSGPHSRLSSEFDASEYEEIYEDLNYLSDRKSYENSDAYDELNTGDKRNLYESIYPIPKTRKTTTYDSYENTSSAIGSDQVDFEDEIYETIDEVLRKKDHHIYENIPELRLSFH